MVSCAMETALVHAEKVKMRSKKISDILFILKETYLSLRIRKFLPNYGKQNKNREM